MDKKNIIVVLQIIICILQVKAQRFNFRNMVGAPASESYYVMQDSKGYMWFATNKGICRYDGSKYRLFNINDGMPDNTVFKLCEDKEGRILFNTSLGKTGYLYKDSVYSTGFCKFLEDKLSGGRASVYDMYIDTNGFFWISIYGAIYRSISPNNYSMLKPIYEQIDTCVEGIAIIDNQKALTSIFKLPFTRKSTKPKLAFYVSKDKIHTRYEMNEKSLHPTFGCSLFLKNGDILTGCQNELIRISKDGKMSTRQFDEGILCLYQDKEGGVWIGFRNKGMVYYESQSLNGIPVWSLEGLSVSNVMVDREGGVWATTLEKGIFYAPDYHVLDYSNNKGLDRRILSLAVIKDMVLANDFSNKLSIIKGPVVTSYYFPAESHVEGIYDYLLTDNVIYVGTSFSLLKCDTTLNNWQPINFKGWNYSKMCYDLALSPSDELYTIDHGTLYKKHNEKLEPAGELPSRSRCMCITKDGKIFIGCANGLYKVENDKIVYMGSENSLLSSKINCIEEGHYGTLWILTAGKGIILLADGKKLTGTITEKDGLASNNCNDIIFDKGNTAWVGTDNGISKISKGVIDENFNTTHGLISSEISKLALQNNLLWVGTGSGLCVMDITHTYKNTTPPRVYINSIMVNNVRIAHDSSFTYNLNNFSFNVCGLTYKDHERNFLYRLVGSDTTWHSSTSNEIGYNNIAPGLYRFEVKALNADGLPSLQAASFYFEIGKPFWGRWWFYLIEIVTGGMAVYLFIQYRLTVIRKKESEKTRINKMLAEYQLDALRAQMNPHFIFNVINSIQNYVLEKDSKQAYDYLAMFAHLIRMMLHNAQEKQLTLHQELQMLRLYINLEQMRFSESFEFILEMDDDIDAGMLHVPSMLIQPYVENAIWHGLMNLKGMRKGVLKVRITLNGALKIYIEDNGIGREQAQKLRNGSGHKSLGMELNRKRVELINTMPGGSETEISVTDLYDGENKACGTKVEIRIPENMM